MNNSLIINLLLGVLWYVVIVFAYEILKKKSILREIIKGYISKFSAQKRINDSWRKATTVKEVFAAHREKQALNELIVRLNNFRRLYFRNLLGLDISEDLNNLKCNSK